MAYLYAVLIYIASGVVALAVLEVMYCAVMGLRAAQVAGTLTPLAESIGKKFALIALVCDVLCNVIWTGVLFLELHSPIHEPTISQRLRRLVKGPDGWRKRLATWFAVNALNSVSVGGPHIPLK